jgi:hypothetical protein
MARHPARMFIRRTNTRHGKTGQAYFTYRLVAAVRVGKRVKQRTLLIWEPTSTCRKLTGPIWLAGSAK